MLVRLLTLLLLLPGAVWAQDAGPVAWAPPPSAPDTVSTLPAIYVDTERSQAQTIPAPPLSEEEVLTDSTGQYVTYTTTERVKSGSYYYTKKKTVTEYQTASFAVDASRDRALAKKIAETAERHFRSFSQEWLGGALPSMSDDRVKISWDLFGPGSTGGGGQTTYKLNGIDAFEFRMSISGDKHTMMTSVLPHEILHVVLAKEIPAMTPHWIGEGPPSTTEEESHQQDKYEKPMLKARVQGRDFSLRQMIGYGDKYPPWSRIWVFYGQANSLAHYLIGLGGGGTAGRRELVEFIRSGTYEDGGWSAAIKKHYGHDTIEDLENAWDRWIDGGGPWPPTTT